MKRTRPCCFWTLGFHKKELATGGAYICWESARTKLELTRLKGRRRSKRRKWRKKACVVVRGDLEGNERERGV